MNVNDFLRRCRRCRTTEIVGGHALLNGHAPILGMGDWIRGNRAQVVRHEIRERRRVVAVARAVITDPFAHRGEIVTQCRRTVAVGVNSHRCIEQDNRGNAKNDQQRGAATRNLPPATCHPIRQCVPIVPTFFSVTAIPYDVMALSFSPNVR